MGLPPPCRGARNRLAQLHLFHRGHQRRNRLRRRRVGRVDPARRVAYSSDFSRRCRRFHRYRIRNRTCHRACCRVCRRSTGGRSNPLAGIRRSRRRQSGGVRRNTSLQRILSRHRRRLRLRHRSLNRRACTRRLRRPVDVDDQPVRIRQQKRRVLRHIVHIQHHPGHIRSGLRGPDSLQKAVVRHREAPAHQLRAQLRPVQVEKDSIRVRNPRRLELYLVAKVDRHPGIRRRRPVPDPGHLRQALPRRGDSRSLCRRWNRQRSCIDRWRTPGRRGALGRRDRRRFDRSRVFLRQGQPASSRPSLARGRCRHTHRLFRLPRLAGTRSHRARRRLTRRPARRILCPQERILPLRVVQCHRVVQFATLFAQQLRHHPNRFGSVFIPRVAMVDRPKAVHHPHVFGFRVRSRRFCLEHLARLHRLLPWGQNRLMPCSCPSSSRRTRRRYTSQQQHTSAAPPPPNPS